MYKYICKYMDWKLHILVQIHVQIHGLKCTDTFVNLWTDICKYMCKYMDRNVQILVQIHGQKCANMWSEIYKCIRKYIDWNLQLHTYGDMQIQKCPEIRFLKRMFDCRCFSKCITHITHCIVRQTYQPIFMLWELNTIDTSSTFHTIFQEKKVHVESRIKLDQNISYQTIPHHTIPYHTIPCHNIPNDAISTNIGLQCGRRQSSPGSNCITPYHTIPYHTIAHPTTHIGRYMGVI